MSPTYAPNDPNRTGQTIEAKPLTEQRMREIIREELWRFHNPNRAYQRDLASQQAQLANPHWSTK